MTPEQAKAAAAGNIQMIELTQLSHFAQLCHKSKERFENTYRIPFCQEWFSLPTNEYNPGLAYASMGVCLSGYKNLPSNDYKYIRGTYRALGCQDVDITSFYHLNDENYIAALDNVNLISYALGHRKIKVTPTQMERDLFIIYGRGTSVSIEWNSNSNVANSVADGKYDLPYHEGFKKTADAMMADVKRYVAEHQIDTSTAIVWVMGHSRGAAITNVLSGMLNEDAELGFTKDRIYSYNFAASPGTRRPDAQGPAFDNIMNIQCVEDYVPRIPPVEWDFVRFGRDLYFPSIATRFADYMRYRDTFLTLFKEWTRIDFPAFHGNAPTNWFERHIHDISPNAADMYCRNRYTAKGTVTFAQYFRFVTDIAGQSTKKGLINDGEELAEYGTGVFERFLAYLLKSQVVGHDSSGAHQEEGYLIKLMLCYEMGIDLEKCSQCDTERFTVYGNVDVTVRDAEGTVVARIAKGKVDEQLYSTHGYLAMYYDKDVEASQVWVPLDGGYQIELTAHNDGAFDCLETKLEPMGCTLEQTLYADVSLPKGTPVPWSSIKAKNAPGQGALQEAPTAPEMAAPHTTTACNNLNIEVSVVGDEDSLPEGEAYNSWNPYGDSTLGFTKTKVVADALAVRNATYGDHVAVHAFHDHHQHFDGWFENGELVSKDKSYVFRIEGNRSLEARFSLK